MAWRLGKVGTVMRGRGNVAAILGGWSVRHRVIAMTGWLVFVVVAGFAASVGQRQMTPDEYAEGDSAQAVRLLDQAGIRPGASEMVLLHSDSMTTDAADFHAAVTELTGGVVATGLVAEMHEPYSSGLISADGHSALVQFTMTGQAVTAYERVQPLLDAAQTVRARHPSIQIEQFGEASANKWFNETVLRDFHRAEWTAVPLALGILLVAFGALLAAVLPVGLAMTAFLAANGLLALVSHRMHVDNSTSSVMLLLGLAVGVDYSLFYLRRVREERAAGRDAATSLRIAAATSGRSVLVSGATVVVAMSGMFLSGMLLFDGFALATIIVVLIAMLGSVTVLPATLSLLGDRVNLGRIPGLARSRRPAGGGRVWTAILSRVLSRPRLSAALSATLLVVLAIPLFTMRTEKLGLDKMLPADTPIVATYHHIAAAFPGGPTPAQVVIQADDIDAPLVRQAIDDFINAALRTGQVNQPIRVNTHPSANLAVVAVPLAGNGSDAASERALRTLRRDVIPATLSTVPSLRAYVAGDLAFSTDFNDHLRRGIAPVLVFVLGLAFLLMLYSFRSVTIAAVSIVLDVLSVAASFGVIVAVFQYGWGAYLVGTTGVGAIESWLPLFAFVVLFGLSMDYHVFVVSRIREAYDGGMSTRDAVAHGIGSTAGVVTSAAAIMVGVFAVLGSLSLQDFKQLGVGLAVAILLDATLVRVVLLPSVLAMLGERSWYLPRWLGWLPRHSVVERVEEPELASVVAQVHAVRR
jgi:uncharacterized membrane protein YdfJ with MMPL/SSD domain